MHRNKGDIIVHDNDQIKIAFRNIGSQLKNMHHSLEHDQEESIKVIKRAKENPKLQAQNGEQLNILLKWIEESQNNNYFDVRSEGNQSQAS